MFCLFFFFFKQKTAYEMRISDWSSDVCSSDLLSVIDGSRPRVMPMVLGHEAAGEVLAIGADVRDFAVGDQVVFAFVPACGHCAYKSEEHTSELQSLMRISYDVFY